MQFLIHSLSLSPSEAKANPAPVTTPRPVTAQEAQEQWREILRSFYPDILTRPYCVPHIYFNRVPYEVKEIGGECVFVFQEGNAKPEASGTSRREAPEKDLHGPKKDKKIPRPATVKPEHMQSDFAQQHVLVNLRVLAQSLHDQALATGGRGQPLFIVSELDFKNYLNVSHYNKATAKMPKIKGQGDFDFLLATKNYGILVAEMKSIGLNMKGLKVEAISDDVLKDRVSKAFKQLDKGVTAAMTAISDVAPNVPVRASLFLPYVSSQQLQRVLQQDVKLLQVGGTSCFVNSYKC
jgi:hypothetical protein